MWPPGWDGVSDPWRPLQGALALLCPARPRSKNKNARRSAIYTRFCVSLAWRCVILRLCGGPAASNQGRKPAQPEQLSRIPATTDPSAAKTPADPTREFAFAGRGGPAASNQGRKPA